MYDSKMTKNRYEGYFFVINQFFRPPEVFLRYADAILDLGHEREETQTIVKNADALLKIIENSEDLKSCIKNPIISETEKHNALNAISDKAGFSELFRNFMGVVVKNRRISFLETILKTILHRHDERTGIAHADVIVANDLSSAQKKSLEESLRNTLSSNLKLNITKDESLIGGLKVVVGSTMIDASVKSKIERMRTAMLEAGVSA